MISLISYIAISYNYDCDEIQILKYNSKNSYTEIFKKHILCIFFHYYKCSHGSITGRQYGLFYYILQLL